MTNPDDILNFYKELYYKEIERKEQITNSLNIQIGVITGFLTIQFYLITNYNFTKDILAFLFSFASSVTLTLSLISIYYLFLTYSNFLKGHSSSGFQTAKEIEDYRNKLINHYRNDNDSICNEFKSYLIDEYKLHYDSSIAVNDKKVKFLFLSKKYSILGLIIIMISAILFLINFFNKDEEVKRIKIDNMQSIERKVNSINNKLDTLNKNIVNLGSDTLINK